MNLVRNTIVTTLIAVFAVLGLAALPATTSYASSPADEINKGLKAAGKDEKCDNSDCTLSGNIKTVVNVLLFIIGTLSVIMIIIGGIRYTASNGDSSLITSAKNTILYAVIGLIVALLAYAIVNFIVDQFIK